MKPKLPTTPSSQRTLTMFFKRTDSSSDASCKRKAASDEENKSPNSVIQIKKTKIDTQLNAETSQETSLASSLTPDQKQKIKDNQMMARLKLVSRNFSLIDSNSIGLTWFADILENEFKKSYFKTLDNSYSSAIRNATVYPIRENIFSWTRYCDLRSVKVVIIGQDPYHGPNQAHGLCFSVQKGVPSPPSLLNMYKELVSDPDVPEFTSIPKHGHLVGWAEQGVLLLNAVLTVEASKANSHKDKGWENLTTSVIKWISSNLSNVVFLLWGSYAQKMGSVVDKSRHTVLTAVHPSPLSAHRGFLGCRHFSKCNRSLIEHSKEPIRWEHLP